MRRVLLRLLLLACAAVAGPCAHAQLPEGGAIELEADSSEIDRKNNRLVFHDVQIRQGELTIKAQLAHGSSLEFAEAEWTFSGDVRISRDGTELVAAEADLHFAGHRARTAVLLGTPVRFEHRRTGADAPTQGEAQRIEYDFDAQVVRLSGEASLLEGQNQISGDSIRYEVGAQRVIAGAEEQGERVRITIVPPPGDLPPPDRTP